MTKLFEVNGKTNDLLNIDNMGKMTRFFLNENLISEDNEIIDVAIYSSSPNGQHPMFDKLLDKNVKITVEIND